MKMVVLWMLFVSFTLVSFYAETANGQPRQRPENPTITVELQVEPDHQPDYLCVITETGDTRAGRGARDGLPDLSLQLEEIAGARLNDTSAPSAASPGEVAIGDIWQFKALGKEDVAVQKLLETRTVIGNALAAMAVSGSADGAVSCDEEPSLCAPRFDIPAAVKETVEDGRKKEKVRLHITCGESIRGVRPEGSRRVAVMFLSLHQGVKKAVQNVRLDGTVATLRLGGTLSPSDVLVGSIIGGHYAYGSSYTSVENRITAPLFPRCVRRVVEMPPVGALPRFGVEVRLNHKSVNHTCLAVPERGTLTVMIPYFRDKGLTILTAEVRDPTEDEPTTRFEASWSGHLPPERITTRLTVVSFSWVPHCFYPEDKRCPHATLSDTGIACESVGRERDTCLYRCDVGEKNLSIELPTTVRFERPNSNETWDIKMSSTNQQLRGYVAASERALELNFREWQHLNQLSLKRYDHVSVVFPDGRTYEVLSANDLPADWHARVYPIPAPGALCTDEVRVRVKGILYHEDQRVRAGTGTIFVKHPSKLERATGTVAAVVGTDFYQFTYGGFRLSYHWKLDSARPHAFDLYTEWTFGSSPFSIIENGAISRDSYFYDSQGLGAIYTVDVGILSGGIGVGAGCHRGAPEEPLPCHIAATPFFVRARPWNGLWLDFRFRTLVGNGEVTVTRDTATGDYKFHSKGSMRIAVDLAAHYNLFR